MQEEIKSSSAQRINVVGTSGCGKSTFSKELAEIIGAPYLEIDKMWWGPDWTESADDKFLEKMESELNRDKWVVDGNYKRTIPIKWREVQMVIWLDYSFLTVLSRAVRRAAWRLLTREELWEGTGNRESLKKLLSRNSIVLWTVNTFHTNRIKYKRAMADKSYSHIRFVRLSNPREARKFLNKMRADAGL